MTDLLLEDLRCQLETEPVPDVNVDAIVRRGRRIQRRRSVARRGGVLAVVGALAGTVLTVTQSGFAERPPLDVTSTITASDLDLVASSYRTGGAFSRGDTLWFADPAYAVDLGTTIQMMYYTADGVVAGVTANDAGDAPREYVYVGTDGKVRELNLPGKVVPGTDAQADRLAYLSGGNGRYTVHVARASTGQELAAQSFSADYTWAGWDLPPVGLTGDYVVVGVDDDQLVINWRTGERAAPVPGAQLPITGGGRALGADDNDAGHELLENVYSVGDSARLRSTEDLTATSKEQFDVNSPTKQAFNLLSPDGRFVLTTTWAMAYDEKERFLGFLDVDMKPIDDPVVIVTNVETGARVSLPATPQGYGWTPDGRLLTVEGSTVTTCDGDTGRCTSRTMPDGPGHIRLAGKYLGS